MTAADERAHAPDLPRLFAEGRYAELEAAARGLIERDPALAGAWKALGVALGAQGRAAEALAAKRQAVALRPDDPEAQMNLGNALATAGELAPAAGCFEAAARLESASPAAWKALAGVLLRCGRLKEAEGPVRQLVALQPGSADAHNELGNLLRELHRMPEAEACYRRALELQPAHAQAWNNLGNTLADLGRAAEAEAAYRRALALAPQQGRIHGNLGNLLKDQGRLAEAQACYRRALELAPGFAGGWSNLLLAMNNDPAVAMADAVAEARRFGQAAMRRAGGPLARAPARREGPLRVGFAGGDFRTHPVAYFLQAWLPHVDPQRLALHAYSTVPREDAMTNLLRRHVPHWRSLVGLAPEAAARRIHADGLDVLVDLAGHTAHNALEALAWRPAPVQASWLGYFATTGLAAVDWVIADEASVPDADRWHFTERVWRLPDTRLCFGPPGEAPPVAPPPCLRAGTVTFGSFQNLGKVNDAVLRAWAAVLARLPLARLRLQNKALDDADTREGLLRRLAAHGVAPDRVRLHGQGSRRAYLAAHAEVDLLLDTFPYPGGTTTCEALWMGVPTVTLAGDRMLARQGAALLQAAGLPEWAARSEEEYVAKAVAFAADVPALQALRASMRERLPRTALFDGARFAARFTEAMEAMVARSWGSPGGSPQPTGR